MVLGPLRRARRTLAYRRFESALAYEGTRLRRSRDPSAKPVLVYQMGKVGSMSVSRSLAALGSGLDVYHVHALTRDGLERFRENYRQSFRFKRMVPPHLVEGLHLRERLDRECRREWKVVSLVRDPVARNVSSFFQVLDRKFPAEQRKEWLRPGADRDVAAALARIFLEITEHDGPLTWFDRELRVVFGVDVYSEPFTRSMGRQILRGDGAHVLVLRLEDLSERGPAALGELLGTEGVPLIAANVGSEKDYSEAYRAFREHVALPVSYLDRMYGSRFARHFYSEDELDAFRRRWRGD